jgi:hypothetical protein
MSLTATGNASDVLTPANQRYLPNMWTYLPYNECYVKFQSSKTQPGSDGNPPGQQLPQGAAYRDSNNQSLFFVEMQEMGGTNFIPFLGTQWGLWVERDIQTYGAIMTTSDPYKSVSPGAGGGAILIGHGMYATTTPPLISLTDSDVWVDPNNHSLGKFDTLHMYMVDGSTPAHLDLGNLTAHGTISVNDNFTVGLSVDGSSRNIRIRGPNNSGQTATLQLIDENNYIKATFGGSTEVASYNDVQFKAGHGAYTATFWGSSGAWNFNSNCGVAGNGAFSTNSTVTIGNIPNMTSVSGPLYKSTTYGSVGTVCFNVSSIRFKENVRELDDCHWIYELTPVMFDWKVKTDNSTDNFGLIAEEVAKVNPKLVWFDEKGIPEGVHYEWLGVPLLVEVKKLQKRIEALELQLKQTAT